ncbi:MAG TPA: hypothetical protein VME01_05325, partial [Solirubrobacteraceae bacterium]|nr:hypothetical protein [Solirubrobacteraceae bacterium]
GVAFFVLLVAALSTSHNSPSAGASGAKVISFYTKNRSSERVSDILFLLAVAFFVMFAGALRDRLRGEREGAATTALAGSVLVAGGIGFIAVLDYALADHPGQLTVSTAQVLNTVDNDAWPAGAIGALIFGVCGGYAVLGSARLPHWLGVVLIVIGIACATPAAFFGLILLILWTLAVSILMMVRPQGRAGAPPVTPSAQARAATPADLDRQPVGAGIADQH